MWYLHDKASPRYPLILRHAIKGWLTSIRTSISHDKAMHTATYHWARLTAWRLQIDEMDLMRGRVAKARSHWQAGRWNQWCSSVEYARRLDEAVSAADELCRSHCIRRHFDAFAAVMGVEVMARGQQHLASKHAMRRWRCNAVKSILESGRTHRFLLGLSVAHWIEVTGEAAIRRHATLHYLRSLGKRVFVAWCVGWRERKYEAKKIREVPASV